MFNMGLFFAIKKSRHSLFVLEVYHGLVLLVSSWLLNLERLVIHRDLVSLIINGFLLWR